MSLKQTLATLAISPRSISHQVDSDQLSEQMQSETTPFNQRARKTSMGALTVDTGRYTGRSPEDKYVVLDSQTADSIWFSDKGSDNKPMNPNVWQSLHKLVTDTLSEQDLIVQDAYAGADPSFRIKVRIITSVAWMAHFFNNMLINEVPKGDLAPADWTILHAPEARCTNYKSLGLNSETFVVFNFTEREIIIGNTWYSGEIKKGIFSVMNYILPCQGVGSFHCSANQGPNHDTAMFFGLSGTGKTTLSADPDRLLIGDDETGWGEEGIFNIEGGCYAKVIDLSAEKEPDIYAAIRPGAILENVILREDLSVDFSKTCKTQNTRVSYPLSHIDNIVKPTSVGGHPKRIIFLTCDAFGVLPPVAMLSPEQAMYHFLSGYTAKIAGTELGVKEPTACFSACYGQPFLMLHPTEYASLLRDKILKHDTHAYLVNTGWSGGAYGIGKRIDITVSRRIISAILSGELDQVITKSYGAFNVQIPTAIDGIDSTVLKPNRTWNDQNAYTQQESRLTEMFIQNFKRFSQNDLGRELQAEGPSTNRVKIHD